MAKRIMIMFCDPMGLPRAYAYGPEGHEREIEARARRELQTYCAEKQALGDVDLANPNNFSMRRTTLGNR